MGNLNIQIFSCFKREEENFELNTEAMNDKNKESHANEINQDITNLVARKNDSIQTNSSYNLYEVTENDRKKENEFIENILINDEAKINLPVQVSVLNEEVSQKVPRKSLGMKNHTPLEIINELLAESCNESFKLSEEKKKTHGKFRSNFFMKKLNENNFDITKKPAVPSKKPIRKKIKNESSEFKISNFISESKLLSKKKDEILMMANFEKFLPNDKLNNKSIYVTKYCILTKTEFTYYKSKESFIQLQQPQLRVLLSKIAYVKSLNIPKRNNKVMHHFYLQLKDCEEIENKSFLHEVNSRPNSIFRVNTLENSINKDEVRLDTLNSSKRDSILFSKSHRISLLEGNNNSQEIMKSRISKD